MCPKDNNEKWENYPGMVIQRTAHLKLTLAKLAKYGLGEAGSIFRIATKSWGKGTEAQRHKVGREKPRMGTDGSQS